MTRASVALVRDPSSRHKRLNFAPWDPGIKFDAQYRTVCRDTGIRNDLVIVTPKVLDAGNQGDIELACGQVIRKVTGKIEFHRRIGQRLTKPSTSGFEFR